MNQPLSMNISGQLDTRFLNGWRGIAALIVIVEHYMYAFFPMVMEDNIYMVEGLPIADYAAYTPANILFNGNAAVALFFVLSGFVLSVGYFANRPGYGFAAMVGRFVKRYFRLAVPVFGSVMAIFLVFQVNGFYQGELAKSSVAINPDFYDSAPTFLQAVELAFVGIMLDGEYTYNPAYWTMKYELFGSMIVFCLLMAFGMAKFANGFVRMGVYIAVMTVTWDDHYWSFVAGMALADLYASRGRWFKENDRNGWFLLLLAPLTVYLLGFTQKGGISGWYGDLMINGITEFQGHAAGAILLLIVTLCSKRIQGVLRKKELMFLGDISFSMYLMHYVVMSSIAAYVHLIMVDLTGYQVAFLISFALVGLPATILVSTYFDKFINKPTILLSNKLASALFRQGVNKTQCKSVGVS